MAHRYRFLVEKTEADCWSIDCSEYNHIANVLRISKGDVVEYCNGAGVWGVGKLIELSKRQIVVQSDEEFFEEKPLFASEIAVGALKVNSMDQIIPDLVELGVTTIHVFQQDEVAKSRLNQKVLKRWDRIIDESLKQCKALLEA